MSLSRLALHADDFGMNRAVSDGILHGFRHGLLTSTSLLANAPDATVALTQWKGLLIEQSNGGLPSAEVRRRLGDPECPFDLGVHLNLTQGWPLGGDRYPAELLDAEGRFPGVVSLFARLRQSGDKLRDAIRDEWRRQIQFLCDHGLRPTHLNGHQYVEMLPATVEIVAELMKHYGIKAVRVAWEPGLLRSTLLHRFQIVKWPLAEVKHLFAAKFRKFVDAREIAHPDAFYGTAHAGGIDLKLLRLFLTSSRRRRFVEIGFHPGQTAEGTSSEDRASGWFDPLALARPVELQMLVSEELPRFLESSERRLGRLQLLGGLTAGKRTVC
jgi:chitin disaccharide deacetylase